MSDTIYSDTEIHERIIKYVNMVHIMGSDASVASVEYGRRYAKVIVNSFGQMGNRSVHSFIDLKNGNILKAGSWKAPQPNGIRGNIFSDDCGRSVISRYGVRYMEEMRKQMRELKK